jgi:hypothetical protein
MRAETIESEEHQTSPGSALGTVAYMSFLSVREIDIVRARVTAPNLKIMIP